MVVLSNINAQTAPVSGEWRTQIIKEAGSEIKLFNIYEGSPSITATPKDIPDNPIVENEIIEHVEEQEPEVIYQNERIQDKLYQIVKEKKIFHTGHYHWSESSRAHNWIDIPKLLENHKDLYFVKNAIVDIIDSFSLNKDCDLMISLGAEGNIIASKASIQFNIKHTSLPYSYRYDESHEYEKQLNYDNREGQFKTVIIIADVVNDGRSLRKLIGLHEKDFFDQVERIIVVSLFYTGITTLNRTILNTSSLIENLDGQEDYVVNCLEFYSVKSLRVEKCPYGKDYKNECFIYKDILSCVHLFYNEN